MNPTNSKNRECSLVYGAVVDSIEKQLTDQGLKFDKETIEHFDRDAEALARCYIRGLITTGQKKGAQARLHSKIMKHLHTFQENK